MTDMMRVCAHIDIAAIKHNIDIMSEGLGDDTCIYVVVKADGYGHGALSIARELCDYGRVGGFCVATFSEAKELRDGGIKAPIIILGYTFPNVYDEMTAYDIRPTIISCEMAKELNEAAARIGRKAIVHIKVDTGMGRIGFLPDENGLSEVLKVIELPNIEVEGIFTHFARADEADKTATKKQYELFKKFADAVSDAGYDIPIRHAANSAAILSFDDIKDDTAVRAGIATYGLFPSDEVGEGLGLYPALSLYSHVVHVKTVHSGTPISYGGTFVTKRDTVVATVPVGYADGYPRSLSNKGRVIIRGSYAPILGRVCMDQFMVDVTDIPDVSVGDKVTLIGKDGELAITAEELGKASGRFNYELVCDLNKRIPRVYDNGTY